MHFNINFTIYEDKTFGIFLKIEECKYSHNASVLLLLKRCGSSKNEKGERRDV